MIRPTILLCSALAAGALAVAPAAPAKDGDVRVAGTCSGQSTSKLKLSPENGRIETGFEVDANVVGQTWRWRLTHNGVVAASGTATTVAPSGSFSVRRLLPNLAGRDTIGATARNPATGEVCRATATF